MNECHAWKISSEDLKIPDRLVKIYVMRLMATAYRIIRQTTERRSERRSDKRYDKAHYLFHAVVGWMSGSEGDSGVPGEGFCWSFGS